MAISSREGPDAVQEIASLCVGLGSRAERRAGATRALRGWEQLWKGAGLGAGESKRELLNREPFGHGPGR